MCRETTKQLVLFLPRERIRQSGILGQHGDQRRHTIKPRTAIGVAVGARGTIQYRTHDFQGAVDCRRARALGVAILDKGLERCIADLLRLKLPDIARKELDVPFDLITSMLRLLRDCAT